MGDACTPRESHLCNDLRCRAEGDVAHGNHNDRSSIKRDERVAQPGAAALSIARSFDR